ncbi:MAG: Co2+/Mg2+ efflux protein ApaG [Planctomycetota bacterium]|nr:Co2+/Mg2+ efflux protein ApaG [Planctomycetota bacterium]
MTDSNNSDTVTQGMRIEAAAQYLPSESDPERGRFIFIYRIRMTNGGDQPVQLMTRSWLIIDADGKREVVRGEGVVGKQPRLAPGETFEYTSYCPLRTDWGTMEGEFHFTDEEGQGFEAKVGRFYMVIAAENVILS